MFTESNSFRILSNNGLKIIACVIMVIDHVGVLIFPEVIAFRVIGRIGFPIFAFLIAEGARHTKNKLRHVLVMAGFAAVIQIVYYIAIGSLEMSVLVTFTLSLLIIYALDHFKSKLFAAKKDAKGIILSALMLICAFLVAVAFDHFLDIDYGLSGCLIPVFPALLTTPKVENPPKLFKTLDTKTFRALATGLGMLAFSISAMTHHTLTGLIQLVSLLSVPILLLYSEKRGRLRMKYFFYFFYPLHLVIIQGIAILIGYLSK